MKYLLGCVVAILALTVFAFLIYKTFSNLSSGSVEFKEELVIGNQPLPVQS